MCHRPGSHTRCNRHEPHAALNESRPPGIPDLITINHGNPPPIETDESGLHATRQHRTLGPTSVTEPDQEPEEPNPARDYWIRARRPWASLWFLLPLLAFYEFGVTKLGEQDPSAFRNGADYWMRDGLAFIGLSNTLLLPIMLMFALFSWHILRGDPWKIRADTILGMLAESVAFACCLVVIGQIHSGVFANLPELKELSVTTPPVSARVVSFVGAGVYEEVLFRLGLVPVLYTGFRLLEIPHRFSVMWAILVSSLVFAGAHYVGPAADVFTLQTFSFRTIAGLFFAGLFFARGFGITVGAHAIYDLVVGVVFASA